MQQVVVPRHVVRDADGAACVWRSTATRFAQLQGCSQGITQVRVTRAARAVHVLALVGPIMRSKASGMWSLIAMTRRCARAHSGKFARAPPSSRTSRPPCASKVNRSKMEKCRVCVDEDCALRMMPCGEGMCRSCAEQMPKPRSKDGEVILEQGFLHGYNYLVWIIVGKLLNNKNGMHILE